MSDEKKMTATKMHTYYPHDDSTVNYFLVTNVESLKEIKKEVKNFGVDNDIPTIFDDHYRPMQHSMYDCTGQWFSSGCKLIGYDDNYNTAIVALYYSCDV